MTGLGPVALYLQDTNAGGSFKAKASDLNVLEMCLKGAVFVCSCSPASEVSRRDIRASRSSSSPPQQDGLKVAHGVPKVVFLVFPVR
jgi:hypothetical protein